MLRDAEMLHFIRRASMFFTESPADPLRTHTPETIFSLLPPHIHTRAAARQKAPGCSCPATNLVYGPHSELGNASVCMLQMSARR